MKALCKIFTAAAAAVGIMILIDVIAKAIDKSGRNYISAD